jgi:glycosyltransferase involved in cell wall biosynthesis
MHLRPLVSVIVPVYNTESHLPICLESLLGQTWDNLEIICVDDGSTDGSLAVVQRFKEQDERVRVFTQSNARQGAARNRGMDEAHGEYIFFMDSDDRLHSHAIETMIALAENEHAEVVSFGMRQVGRHEGEMADIGPLEYLVTESPLDYCNTKAGYRIVCTPCRLYRSKILKGIRFIPGISYEDEAFTWEVMLRHPRTVMVKNALYDYLQNPHSTMHWDFTARDVRYFCQVIDYLLEIYPERGKDRRILVRKIIPRLLKEQYMRISNLQGVLREEVECAFAQELRGLRIRNVYSIWGIGLRRHLNYRKLFCVHKSK